MFSSTSRATLSTASITLYQFSSLIIFQSSTLLMPRLVALGVCPLSGVAVSFRLSGWLSFACLSTYVTSTPPCLCCHLTECLCLLSALLAVGLPSVRVSSSNCFVHVPLPSSVRLSPRQFVRTRHSVSLPHRRKKKGKVGDAKRRIKISGQRQL